MSRWHSVNDQDWVTLFGLFSNIISFASFILNWYTQFYLIMQQKSNCSEEHCHKSHQKWFIEEKFSKNYHLFFCYSAFFLLILIKKHWKGILGLGGCGKFNSFWFLKYKYILKDERRSKSKPSWLDQEDWTEEGGEKDQDGGHEERKVRKEGLQSSQWQKCGHRLWDHDWEKQI